MKTILSCSVLLALVAAMAAPGVAGLQSDDKALDGPALRGVLENMGYSLKELNKEAGKEKFEFMIAKDGYDVYIAAEVSPSKRFVWLTSFLGETAKISDFDSKASKFLNRNTSIQPTQFYITDRGNLMIAIATDNRDLNPAVIRHRVEKLAGDVSATSDLWANKS